MFFAYLGAFLLLIFHSYPLIGADVDSVVVTGGVMDGFTRHYLKGVHVEAFHLPDMAFTDSTTIKDEADAYAFDQEAYQFILEYLSQRERMHYKLMLPAGRYMLRCSLSGYDMEETEVSIPAKRYGKRTKDWELDDIILSRERVHQLKELKVTASRVKMVTRGDTIVYNADAFQLADGSMLDELIKLMPGLEIRNGSEIYHDGVYVPELLLNGRDFFKGDPAVALANLPAYAVKELRVYHRAPDGAYLRKNTAPDTLRWNKVLDVLLKHMYVKEWIANAEGGGGVAFGEHKKDAVYLGRLFGLRLTEHSHLGTYVNFNNLNDKQGASSQGTWNDPRNELSGTSHVQKGGINYNLEGKRTHIKFNSSLTGEHSINEILENTSSTTFLPSSDVFSRIRLDNNNERAHLFHWNDLRYKGKNLSASFILSWLFSQNEAERTNRSVQFTQPPDDGYIGAAIDSIFLPIYSPHLTSMMSNRLSTNDLSIERRWQIEQSMSADLRSPLTGNILSVGLTSFFSSRPKNLFSHYDLQYAPLSEYHRDFRNKHQTETARELSNNLKVGYEGQRIGCLKYAIEYHYRRSHTNKVRDIYRIDYLDDFGADSQLPLGMLPSVSNWKENCLDKFNSFDAHHDDFKHELNPGMTIFFWKERVQIHANSPLTRLRREVTDTRALNGPIQKRYFFVSPHLSLECLILGGEDERARIKSGNLSLEYEMTHSAPSGNFMMDLRDDADPLRIMLGNPNLKPAYSHRTEVVGLIQGRIWASECHVDYKSTMSAVAQSMAYNRLSGAYTFKPENVNGNWESGIRFHLIARSARSSFSGNNILEMRYLHSVDLVSPDGISNAAKSIVDNRLLSNQIRIKYQKGRLTIGLNSNINWSYATSERVGFKTRSTADLQEGLSLNVTNLIYGISVMTDINMYHRFGYEDASMNDQAVVWNAQLSRPLDKNGKWNLKLRGYDLLRQLSTVRRTLNSQGLTETWTNTLPSYLMLHIAYHFNKKPQK